MMDGHMDGINIHGLSVQPAHLTLHYESKLIISFSK